MAVITLRDYRPSARHDGNPWTQARIEGGTTSAGPWSTLNTLSLSPVDNDPADPAIRSFTTEAVTSETWLRVVFRDQTGDSEYTLPVPLYPVTLATARDVAARLGREITDDEEPAVGLLLEAATAAIAEAAGKPDSWPATLAPVPLMLKFVCVELACRSLGNPGGLTHYREQLGQYSYAQNYPTAGAGGTGLLLSKAEELLVRRVVLGRLSDSVPIPSMLYGS